MSMHIYDIEVYAHDWLVVFHDLDTGEEVSFHNGNYAVKAWLDAGERIIGGYNSKHYDNWILKAIYHGADNGTVKAVSDGILAGADGWRHPFLRHKAAPWTNFDLMDDTAVPLRLKEIEGNLGLSVEECPVPFDLMRPWTPAELEQVTAYCRHDVDATVRLYHARKSYLDSKIAVGAMAGLDRGQSLHLTNAKLTAAYLGARFYDRGDATEYAVPENLRVERYRAVLDFFSAVDPTYESKLETDIAGVPHTFGWGGLHGARPRCRQSSAGRTVVAHLDVTSYYPSLMILNGYMSRSVPDPERFREVYRRRVEAKAAGDKDMANALKLVLNSTYGAMKNPYNNLYDPRMANAVCISGQLYLVDLIERLEEGVAGFGLIQSNTDGLIVRYPRAESDAVAGVIAAWEARTGLSMAVDEIDTLVQKDVNNYVMRDSRGGIDVKGGYVSNYGGGDFTNRSLVVVHRAVVAALLDGTPVEETIGACGNPLDFQMICKAGRTYDQVVWGEVPVQMTNRVYAARNRNLGTLRKVKDARPGQPARRDRIANLPDHCMLDNGNTCRLEDIDRQFYIDLAARRVTDYVDKKEEEPMATIQENARIHGRTEAGASGTKRGEASGLYRKLFELQSRMDGYGWEKDGTNNRHKYKYITEAQYKKNFKAARAQAGLLWKMEEVGHELIPIVSDKMHLVLTQFVGRLIDPDTGAYEEYRFSGSGADNGDKALYKAYTGGLKFFLASNFLVAEDNDPEDDAAPVGVDRPAYARPDAREEALRTAADQDAPAADTQLESIAMGITLLADAGVDEAIVDSVTEMLNQPMTRAEAEALLDAINEVLSKAGA